jgi:tetratricopeptide (TPR) repeat protein
MRSVFDGSWRWLSDEERGVLCRLSVFQGGFTLEAAEQAAGASPPILSALIDKSLLRRSPQPDRTTRYDMHELIRQYAHERLEASGQPATSLAQEAHLNYFLSFVEQAERYWDTEQERQWLQLLEAERGNIHAALRWALENGKTEHVLRLNAALLTFWIYISPATEAGDLIEASLALQWDERSPTMMRARAKALNVAGFAAAQNSNFERALSHFQEGLALCSALEDQRGTAWSLRGCGFVLLIRGDLSPARTYCERSLAICREANDKWGEAWSVYDLGNIALAGGELAPAKSFLESALEQFREQGIQFGEFRALISLGHLMRGQGRWAQAEDFYRQSLAIQQRTNFLQFVAQIVEGMAHIAVAFEDHETGVQLFGAAQARRDSIEMVRWVHQERDYQSSLALTRDQLPTDVWQLAWDKGYTMIEQHAVELALTIHVG